MIAIIKINISNHLKYCKLTTFFWQASLALEVFRRLFESYTPSFGRSGSVVFSNQLYSCHQESEVSLLGRTCYFSPVNAESAARDFPVPLAAFAYAGRSFCLLCNSLSHPSPKVCCRFLKMELCFCSFSHLWSSLVNVT